MLRVQQTTVPGGSTFAASDGPSAPFRTDASPHGESHRTTRCPETSVDSVPKTCDQPTSRGCEAHLDNIKLPNSRYGTAVLRCSRSKSLPLPENITPTIGPRVRHIRQEKGFTVEALPPPRVSIRAFCPAWSEERSAPLSKPCCDCSRLSVGWVGQLFGEQTTDETVQVSRAAGRSTSFRGSRYIQL